MFLPLPLYSLVAMETCLFVKPLPSNGCCIVAYFVVVAQQRVYMPQYCYSGIRDELHVHKVLVTSVMSRKESVWTSANEMLTLLNKPGRSIVRNHL
jgi:hypothetical protein